MADRVGGGSPHVSREQVEAAAKSLAEQFDYRYSGDDEFYTPSYWNHLAEAALSAAATARPDPDPDWEKVARELYEAADALRGWSVVEDADHPRCLEVVKRMDAANVAFVSSVTEGEK